MKKFIILIILTSSVSVQAQKKVYSSASSNQKVKGTFLQLEKVEDISEQESFIAAGSVLASVATPAINSTLGLIRSSAEKKKELSQSTSTSDIFNDSKTLKAANSGIKMKLENFYVEQSGSTVNSFQVLNFSIRNDDGKFLEFGFEDFSSSYSKAFIKKGKDMLVYSITLAGTLVYFEKQKDGTKKLKTKDYSTELAFNVLSANPSTAVNLNRKTKVVLPEVETPSDDFVSFSIQATLKETNPYFQSYSSLAKFLENYGENITSIITGALIESEDE